MKQHYVECKGIPDQEKDQKGNLLRFTIPYHLITESQIRTVGYYDFELKQWWAEDHPESTVKSYLKPITIPSKEEIHDVLINTIRVRRDLGGPDEIRQSTLYDAATLILNLFRKEG